MVVVGVDGCRAGWFAVVLRDGADPEGLVLAEIAELDRAVPDAAVVAIDIPIGLPRPGDSRPADRAARTLLGPRRSSVFPAPSADILAVGAYAQANAQSRALTEKGISKQAFALGPKILQVQAWLPITPATVFEVHPEVSFAVLLGAPAQAYKKTEPRMRERRDALAGAGIDVDHLVGDASLRVGFDDVMDAAAAAWSARRLAAGTARSFPDDPPVDPGTGRPVAIWA